MDVESIESCVGAPYDLERFQLSGVAGDFTKTAHGKTLVYYNFPSPGIFARLAGAAAEPTADLVYLGGLSARAGIFVLFDALKILAQSGLQPSV